MSDAHVVLWLLVSNGTCIYWTMESVTVLEAEPLGYLAPL